MSKNIVNFAKKQKVKIMENEIESNKLNKRLKESNKLEDKKDEKTN